MVQESGQRYGVGLPDQVDRIVGAYDTYLELIGDVRGLYTARAALEREYAAKIQLLTRKASDKQFKFSSTLAFGAEPTKAWDGNAVRQSTINAAYEAIITSMTKSAQDHMNYADQLTTQTIDMLMTIEKRNEDAKKTEVLFFQKLVADRDRIYADRLKSKQKYDEECTEVESFRQKQGRASDDKHSDRAAKQAEQQRNDMLNSKNSYLISIAIANQAKAKFYNEDIPSLENELQQLQRRLVERFAKVLIHSQQLHINHLDTLKSRVAEAEAKFSEVNVSKDQDLFIEYNLRAFIAPADWKFEPCDIHYDMDAMSTEPAPKIVLQNKLQRSREKLSQLHPLIRSKGAEVTSLSTQLSSYTPDHSIGVIDELTDKYLEAEHQSTFYATSGRILNTEIDVILKAIGDDEGPSNPHSFKSSSFSIPTQCGYCKSSIWGLSKQGKICKTCGLSVHAKCELKVPASCEQSENSQSTMLFRKGTNASRSGLPEPGPAIVPSASSFVQSISSEASSTEEFIDVKVLFDFTATSEFELGVNEGDMVRILEADDGSGWVKVAGTGGSSGLVPASYLETLNGAPANREAEQRGTTKRVQAIYPYTAQTRDELSLQLGDILVLSTGSTGGENYADGWWEGEKWWPDDDELPDPSDLGFNAEGRKGIFPSTYVESV